MRTLYGFLTTLALGCSLAAPAVAADGPNAVLPCFDQGRIVGLVESIGYAAEALTLSNGTQAVRVTTKDGNTVALGRVIVPSIGCIGMVMLTKFGKDGGNYELLARFNGSTGNGYVAAATVLDGDIVLGRSIFTPNGMIAGNFQLEITLFETASNNLYEALNRGFVSAQAAPPAGTASGTAFSDAVAPAGNAYAFDAAAKSLAGDAKLWAASKKKP